MDYQRKSPLDYKDIAENLRNPAWYDLENDTNLLDDAATAITDLLARAEAAEADRDRLREALKPNCILCDSMHENGNCTEVGGFCTAVPAAHCPLIPRLRDKLAAAEARAEKAEKQRDEYFKHLQGRCFCCGHKSDGFDCHTKCYGHKRGSAWVYARPEKEE